MAGRPKQFDRDEALSIAMHVFWRKGFGSTSVEDLINEMNISRGSMYATFGDKRSLFLQSIQFYSHMVKAELIDPMLDSRCPMDRMQQFLRSAVGQCKTDDRHGCLIANTVMEQIPHDEAIATVVRDLLDQVESGISHCIAEGVKTGRMQVRHTPHLAARMVLCTVHGIFALSKTYATDGWMEELETEILGTLMMPKNGSSN